jgi:hypothetical protein
MRDPDEFRDRFMEWLRERAEGSTTVGVNTREFANDEGLDSADEMHLARECADRRLINEHSGLSRTVGTLTLSGIRYVNAQRARRNDPVQRRTAARDGLLRWLHEQDPDGDGWTDTEQVLTSGHSWFEGSRLTADEIYRAAEYLKRNGLIDGIEVAEFRGPVKCQITFDGQECMERGGNVANYIGGRRTATSITTSIGTINNSGAMAIGSTDNTQHVSANVDPTVMAAFVQMLLRELPNLQLGTDREAAASTALVEVQREVAQANPDGGRVTQAFGRFAGYVGDAGKPVLTALLMLIAQHYGLPHQ